MSRAPSSYSMNYDLGVPTDGEFRDYFASLGNEIKDLWKVILCYAGGEKRGIKKEQFFKVIAAETCLVATNEDI